MDKEKKKSPAGASRRAYSIFGGIINLGQGSAAKSNGTGPPAQSAVSTGNGSISGRVAAAATQDPQGPSNVYTVTVSSVEAPCPDSTTKTYENVAAMKKKRSDHSPSANSSLSNSHPGHRSGSNSPSARIGPAPRTLSILTALNELAISDEIRPNPVAARKSSKSNLLQPSTSRSGSTPNTIDRVSLPSQINVAGLTCPPPVHPSPSTSHPPYRAPASIRNRDRCKSRTPDWIWKIFQLTKHGNLDDLQESLEGLDPTLIRHLADFKGNNVLHCAARGGHVNTLKWLVSVLGAQAAEALADHNQAGRTVILTALRKGQLGCLQWLIHNTKTGEKALVPTEGERSLLHFASSQGNINVVKLLCNELQSKGKSVDVRDSRGMTPLHDAAKSGHIIVCHELVLAGGDPLSQTELGWRPSDLAIRHRHVECASYFILAEAAGSLANQLHAVVGAYNQLRQEHEELRLHFRETLRVGKWLAKERNDLIKHVPSNWSEDVSSLLLGGGGNGARLSELEHKLVVAEEAWRNLSQTAEDPCDEDPSVISPELHTRLQAIQQRQRSQSVSELSGSESDTSLSDASSSDGDPEVVTSLPAVELYYNQGLPQFQPARRTKAAPWLLPPNDHFLSQLSPFGGKSLSTLDLLNGAPSSTAEATTDAAGKNEKSLAQMDGGKRDSMEVSVLEVIEPGSHASTSASKKGEEPFQPKRARPWLGGLRGVETGGGGDETKRECDPKGRRGKPPSSSDLETFIPNTRRTKPVEAESGQMLLNGVQQAPDLICGTHYRSERKEEESCYSQSREDILDCDPIYEPIGVCEHRNHLEESDDGPKLDIFIPATALDQESLRDKSRPSTSEQVEGASCSSPVHTSGNLSKQGGPSVGCVTPTRPLRTPSPKSYITKLTVLPVETSETCFLSLKTNFFPDRDLPGDTQEELGHLPSDSVSSSNTPVMPRFHSSGTVVFPLRKSGWHSQELLSQTTPDSSLVGRLSPTPSENSRTESALAAPPHSYVSHASQNSEMSKTESATGQGGDEADENLDAPQDHSDNNFNPGPSIVGVVVFEKNAAQGVRRESRDSYNLFKEQEQQQENRDVPDNRDGCRVKRVFQSPRLNHTSLRSQLSTGSHKAAQRIPKGSRGQSKAWYEIEGSDDEGSLLRVAKSRTDYSSKSCTTIIQEESRSQSESMEESGGVEQEEQVETESENSLNHDSSEYL